MLDSELLALRRAMIPLKAYATQARRTIDASDPRQARRFAHVQDIEAALNAGADLYERLTPPDTPLVARIKRHLAQPSMIAFAALPETVRKQLAQLSDYYLPSPDRPE